LNRIPDTEYKKSIIVSGDYEANELTIIESAQIFVNDIPEEAVISVEITGKAILQTNNIITKENLGNCEENIQYITLITSNKIETIQVKDGLENIKVDSQNYKALMALKYEENYCDITDIEIPELTCDYTSNGWVSPTCPCNGDSCIFDVRKVSTFSIEGSELQKVIVGNITLKGELKEETSLAELVVEGNSSATIQLKDISIEEVNVGESALIDFQETLNISTITGGQKSKAVFSKSPVIGNIKNIDVQLELGTVLRIDEGNTISNDGREIIITGGRIDVYSKSTNFEGVKIKITSLEPGQMHAIAIDDNAETSILRSDWEVNIDKVANSAYRLLMTTGNVNV